MTRLQVMGEAVKAFGPSVEINEDSRGYKVIGRLIGSKSNPIAFASYGVSGKTWMDLHVGIKRHFREARRSRALSWLIAAADAAALGYDVREPSKQLVRWIEEGHDDEEET